MTTYLETAENIYDSVRATHAALVEVYEQKVGDVPTGERDQWTKDRARTIASLHEAIRFGGKAAEVGALLSIARSLETIARGPEAITIDLEMPTGLPDRVLSALEQERLAPRMASHVICTCGDWHRRGQTCPVGGEIVGDVV